MNHFNRSILVLYGSETGNAQDMAEELGRVAQRLHFQSQVEELNTIELKSLLQHQLIIFVISTTGQGDMPHNSSAFWKKLLRKRLPPDCLHEMKYTCFGLGDSTYLKFNWAARKLNRRLEQLGANTFMEPFEADEQFPDGVEGAFARWAEDLQKHLVKNYPLQTGLEPIPDDVLLPSRWPLELAFDSQNHVANAETARLEPAQSLGPLPHDFIPVTDSWVATIAGNKRLTPKSHWQDVRLVQFDIYCRRPAPSKSTASSEKLLCNPGDCLTIYPKNFPEDVQKLIDLMDWQSAADLPIDLSRCLALPRALEAIISPSLSSSSITTIRTLLLHHIDFMSTPRRSFLKAISHFSTDSDHRERLIEFTQAQYIDEYFDYATRSRRTIIEVLEEFTSVKIPADRILDVFPLIRGRDFSIANGGAHLCHPSDPNTVRVELLVALVRYRTILRKPRQGLCSRYLADLPVGHTLRVTHKPALSPIHGAKNAKRPLVAMATGTGIAPVRCLIQERLTHPSRGPTLIFFGNRNRDADFFFQEEWQTLSKLQNKKEAVESDEPEMQVFPAFSRDQREKIYVQDLVRHESPRMEQLVSQNAIFSVCGGSTKMADACKRAVFDPLVPEGDEAGKKALMASVTWWQEIW